MSEIDDTLDVSKLGPRVNLEAIKAAMRNIDKASMEDMMAKMKAMAEETKQDGGDKETLTKKLAAELGAKIQETMKARGADDLVWKFFVFVLVVAILFCILVFFGYKLYRSLTDKERKREEKRKLKLQKKKK